MSRILVLIWQAILNLGSKWSGIDSKLLALNQAFRDMQEEQARQGVALAHIIELLTPDPPVKFVIDALVDDGRVLKGVTQMKMSYTQKVTLTLTAVDKKGKPAVLDGVPEWLSSNTDIVTVAAAADGMSAEATAVGALGTCNVSVTADSKLGDEVNPIIGSLEITITPGEATQITITAGAPGEQEG